MKKSNFSADAMNQLTNALENANFTCDDVAKLAQFKDFQAIKELLAGTAFIKHHDINTSVNLYSSAGELVVVGDSGFGIWRWDPNSIKLFIDESSYVGAVLRNNKDKKWLTGGILDYLLDHPELIPENWKKVGMIAFLGTTYSVRNCDKIYRFIAWAGDRWFNDYFSYDFNCSNKNQLVFPEFSF